MITFVETAAWGAVLSFEIPDSEGDVAEMYFSREQEQLEEIRVGVELYRIVYNASNQEIIDIVPQNSGSRRALHFQSEARDYQLPGWMNPSAVGGAMTSRISCDNCGGTISLVCKGITAMCGTGLIETNLATGALKATLYGVSTRVLQAVIPAFRIACLTTGLCILHEWGGITDALETCADIFCCDNRLRCGPTCYKPAQRFSRHHLPNGE